MNIYRMKHKFIAIIICLFCLNATALAQIDDKITLVKENISVKSALLEVQKQSGITLNFNESKINAEKNIKLNLNKVNTEEAIAQILKSTQFTFKRQGNNYLIYIDNTLVKEIVVKGTVVDAQNVPVIGANILVKGTTTGTITDIDGQFTLNAHKGDKLVISYIGFINSEVVVANASPITIKMKEDSEVLDEVVVVGYGTMKKSDITGAISSVSSKQFSNEPVRRVDEILQGRSAGVTVTNLSGMPGAGVQVRVRGTTSINKSSEPLYVIDGIVSVTGLNGLNPSDIESMEVLKDASSTAIYGSRGANGVVLVTTKKGSAGKMQIYAEVSIGISNIMKKYDLLNAYEYATALNDIKGGATISPKDMEAYRTGRRGIDWQDLMLKTGIAQDYKVGFSGGTEKARYHISANVLDQTAMTITSKYQRAQIRANFDNELTKWLSISTKLNAARVHSHNTSIDMMSFLNYSPTMKMKDRKTGLYNKDPFNCVDWNPFARRYENYEDGYNYLFNANLDLRFTILKGLTLSVQGGLNYTHNPAYTFSSKVVGPGMISEMSNTSNMGLFWQNTNNLTYDANFGKHHLAATGVYELTSNEFKGLRMEGSNLANEFVGYWNVKNAASRDGSNFYSRETLVSALARIAYGFDNKYLATVTFRADGSSKFQKGNKWGFFPSVALAWDIAKENFMQNQSVFQQLKLRGSFGITGNQAIDSYSTLGMLGQTKKEGFGSETVHTGYWANSLATPDVTWEKTYQYNVGVDAGFLDGRINVTLEYFYKNSSDLLFRKPVPLYNGGGSFWVNQGEVKNTGFEMTINAYPLSNASPVMWETSLNASFNKNTVVDLAGSEFLVGENFSMYGGGPMQITKVGYPINSFYLYNWKGYNKNGANLYERLSDGALVTNPSADDLAIQGKADPSWTFGWNNTITYKNWSLNIFMNAGVGFDRLNVSHYSMASQTGKYRFISLRDAYYKSWDKVENKADARYASQKASDNKNYPDSNFWLENASYLKIKNISLSYDFPKRWTKFADIKLSVSAQNVCTLTKYSGMDPEVYNSHNGIDLGAYPIPRTFTFGMKLNF